MNHDEAVSRRLLSEIESMGEGTRLPSERALAESEGVSRVVARQALQRLVFSGRIEATARNGYAILPRRLAVRLTRGGGLLPKQPEGIEWQVENDRNESYDAAIDVLESGKPCGIPVCLLRSGRAFGESVAQERWRFYGAQDDTAGIPARVAALGERLRITGVTDFCYNMGASGDGPAEPWLRIRSEGRDSDGTLVYERELLLRPERVRLTWGEEDGR